MSTAKNLAGAAVTALIKSDPSALAIAGGKEAVGWLIDRLPGREQSARERLIAEVARTVEALPAEEFGGVKAKAAAITNAEVLFASHGLSASELVDVNLKHERATRELLKRGKDQLDRAGDRVAGLVRGRIVPTVHQRLLADPGQIEALKAAIFQALLGQRDAIRRLDDKLRHALELMTGWWLVTDPRRHWPRDRTDAAILRAEYRVVDFHPERQAALAALQDWCAAGEAIGVQLITGPGGTGKTRLAIQLLGVLGPAWRAGFLHRRAEDVLTFALDGVFAEQERPLLLVVDYAETRRPVVEAILAHLRERGAPQKVRVLLLARAAADWWRALQTGSGAVRDLFAEYPPTEMPLTRIAADPTQRKQVFEAALADYARALRTAPVAPRGIDLDAPHFDTPLLLHIAALAALEGAVPRGEQALLDWALGRERGLWLQRQGDDEARAGALAQAAALLTLAGGAADGAEALATSGRWPPLKAKGEDALLAMFDLLGQLYPQDEGATGVRPDLLGEHLVDQELSRAPRLLGAALAGPAAAPLTVLTRLARRRTAARRWLEQAFADDLQRLAEPAIQVAIETGDPIGPVLAAALERRTEAGQLIDDDQLRRLEAAVPHATTALREVGAAVMAQMGAGFDRIPKPWSEDVQVEAARVANNLANRLSDLGRREAALAAAEEAVRLRRTLAAARPDAFTPDLAMSLNNLGNILSGLGPREEALAAAEEAVRLRRTLAAGRPDAFTHDLASSLNNLSTFLSDLGRREAALAAAEEACDLYRALARARPDAFSPNLATTLNNLSGTLSDLGRREDALAAGEEAVRLHRTLAATRPDAFTPDLAGSLNNLATFLSSLGRREAALVAAEEACDLYRALARARPDAFTPDLAMSLNNLANRLSDLGRREDALAAAEEAVRLRRTLAAARPDAFTPNLAASFNNLSAFLSDLGRREEALAAVEEAVRLRRTLAAARPDAFTPDLAGSLNNLANRLSALGRREDALAAAEEAADLYRVLAAARPDAFTPDLAMSLHNLARALSDLGRREDALAAAEEAVATLGPYFLARPLAFAPWMTTMARNYVGRCQELDREPDTELLGPITAALQRLEQEGGPSGQARGRPEPARATGDRRR